MNVEENIKAAALAVHEANAILITAGAGIGVDSGLPDFRGNEGFWKAYPPIAKLGKSFIEMANPEWFEINPKIAWAFYGHRLNLYRETAPHKGFEILLKWAVAMPSGYFVFTSNVDGQFQKAGFSDSAIYEVHGSIHHFQCVRNCTYRIWTAKNIDVEVDMENFQAKEPLPECPECGGLARPNILMFGDWAWNNSRSSTQAEAYHNWLLHLEKYQTKLVIIEVGAGSAVPTVRMESGKLFKNLNAKFIRINLRDFRVPEGAISIPLSAKDGIEKINKLL